MTSAPRPETPALSRRHLLRASTTGTATALALAALGACGVGTENRAATATGTATDADTAPAAQASTAGTASATSWTLPDPRSLTGLAQAEDLGDIEAVTGSPAPVLPATTTDATGAQVTVTDVSRIVVFDIYGTLSRVVEGLGLTSNIVGRGQTSAEAAIASVPVVTQDALAINVEGLLSVRPTVLVTDATIGEGTDLDKVRAAGVPVVLVKPQRTVESIEDDIMPVADALGVSAEGRLLATRARTECDEALATIAQWVPDEPLRMAFLYVRGTGGTFFVMGKGYADVLIGAIGGRDVATEAGMGDLTPATAEALATLDPEVIITMTKGVESTGGLEGLLSRAGVAQTTAGRNQRIVTAPDSQVLSYGAMTGPSLLATARAVYQPVAS